MKLNKTNYYIITHNLTIVSGGVRDAVKGLSKGLIRLDCKVDLFGIKDRFLNNEIKDYNGIDLHINSELRPRRFGYTRKLYNDLVDTLKNRGGSGVIDLHGLWMHKGIVATSVSKKFNIPVIIHPHGHLDSWALKNKSFIKKVAYFLYEKSVLSNASGFRALTEKEVRSLQSYKIKKPIALIPNGVFLDEFPNNIYVDKGESPHVEYAVYMARITEQKGLEVLLRAWKKSTLKNRLKLKIAGPDYNNYEALMKKLSKKIGISDSVEFIGVVGGEEKSAVLANARLFILPSFSEGFSIALLEASASKLPIIMTKYCNFERLREDEGALESDGSVDSLVDKLNIIYNLTDFELNSMGSKNFDLISKNYTWDSVAAQYCQFTNWLTGKTKNKPNFVFQKKDG
jgi:glycosyltransferase involved in cell wall biosynthesis